MPKDHARRHTKAETDLSRTSRTDSAHERNKARPDAEDLKEPEEVWKDTETTPAADEGAGRGGGDRVADAGDVGGGQASPYGTQAQADAIARQTKRRERPPSVEKPKRR